VLSVTSMVMPMRWSSKFIYLNVCIGVLLMFFMVAFVMGLIYLVIF